MWFGGISQQIFMYCMWLILIHLVLSLFLFLFNICEHIYSLLQVSDLLNVAFNSHLILTAGQLEILQLLHVQAFKGKTLSLFLSPSHPSILTPFFIILNASMHPSPPTRQHASL